MPRQPINPLLTLIAFFAPDAGAAGEGGSVVEPCEIVLTASDAVQQDLFGNSVSISGDTAVIGAKLNDDVGSASGSAYVFTRTNGVWTEQQNLTASDAAQQDQFGSSVSISGDTAVIGAPRNYDAGDDSGSAYVFTRTNGVWTEQQKLTAFDAAEDEQFGFSVSISGDTAVIGALGNHDAGAYSGAAYVYTRTNGVWTEQQKLFASDPAPDGSFGNSVSISGDTAVIGALGNDDAGAYSGSAYAFTRTNGVWTEQQKLTAFDAAQGDQFGNSVSISGDTAVIGANLNDDAGSGSGSAYVFTRTNGVWTEQQKLTTFDAAQQDQFGWSVSISGDTAVIGASRNDDAGTDSGSAYAFTRTNGVWTEQQKLTAFDAAQEDEFGTSVSISGDTAVIGAFRNDDAGTNSGSAHVFRLTDHDCNSNGVNDVCDIGNGTNADMNNDAIPDICAHLCSASKLTSSDAAAVDSFGRSVSISGDTAVIGALGNDDAGSGSGSAYVFTRTNGVWTEQQKLTASDAAANDSFGWSVSISGDTAVIGANFNDDAGSDSGSAYVFTRTNGVWTEQQKLTASDAAANDSFGWSVSISGDTAVIGANFNDDAGSDSGSAYVFTRTNGVWTEQQKLTASDAATYVSFGWSVSISGDTAVIGTWAGSDAGIESGSAYVFTRTNGVWTEQQELTALDAAEGDQFGLSVSISGDTAVIGAWANDDAACESGSAYVFTRTNGVWTEQQKLTASDAAEGDQFGLSVSISGDKVVIGANGNDDVGLNSGSAYVFTRTNGVWTEQQNLTASDAAADDRFGWSVSISGDTAVIGAYLNDDAGSGSGSAYVFAQGVTDCNQNDQFDACDLEQGITGDCNGNGVPDDCEVPQTGEVISKWLGGPGVWDDMQANESWCLPETPNNNVINGISTEFRVLIDGNQADVRLNVSPTISGLTVSNGAILEVNEFSGAPVRSIFVAAPPCPDPPCTDPPPIFNTGGMIRARNGIRLILDAADINQDGGGELRAEGTDSGMPNGVPSRIEISGRTVRRGKVAATDGGIIELTGSGELLDVVVEGTGVQIDNVLVPAGDTGALSGTIENDGIIAVGTPEATTASYLVPDETGAILTTTKMGMTGGCVAMKNRFSRLGEFKGSLTNAANHRIEGAGRIFGTFTNAQDAYVIAKHPTDPLIINTPGSKTNHGTMRATEMGTLRIDEPLTHSGASAVIEATNCGLVYINAPIIGDMSGNGLMATCDGSIIQDSDVDVASVAVEGDGSGLSQISVCDGATLNVAGALTIEDVALNSSESQSAPGGCAPPPPPSECAAATAAAAESGGCAPPPPPEGSNAHLHLLGSARVNIVGPLRLTRAAGVSIPPNALVTLAGDFDNQGTRPEVFEWSAGSAILFGVGTAFEVAGEDSGPVPDGFNDNFAMGTLALAPGAAVTFRDSFDNDQMGQDPCSEGLYLDTFAVGSGAVATIDNCRIYVRTTFINDGTIIPVGCGAILPVCAGDFSGDCVLDLDDFAALRCCADAACQQTDPTECFHGDMDSDGDVDLIDFGAFQDHFDGG